LRSLPVSALIPSARGDWASGFASGGLLGVVVEWCAVRG